MHTRVYVSLGAEKMLQFIRGFIPQKRFAYFKAVFHSVSAVLYSSCFKHIIISAFAWAIIFIAQIIYTAKNHFAKCHNFARQYYCWNNQVFSALKISDFLNIHLCYASRVENYCFHFGRVFLCIKENGKGNRRMFSSYKKMEMSSIFMRNEKFFCCSSAFKVQTFIFNEQVNNADLNPCINVFLEFFRVLNMKQ